MQHEQSANQSASKKVKNGKGPTVWKKRLVTMGVVALPALACLALAAGLLAKRLITIDLLEEEIEKSINSDIRIGAVDVSLFRLPAKVTIKDVSIHAKDGKPAAEPPVKIGEASLSVGLWGLLQKHIDVTNITIREAEITATYHEDGTTSLQKLFESPDEEKRKRYRGNKEKRGGFNVYEQEEFIASLGGLFIENSKVELVFEGMGLRLQCLDVDVELSSIKIDPKQLSATNNAKLKMSSHVRIDSSKGSRYGDLHINGRSTTRIFNPSTGDVEPEVRGDFDLGDDSWLSAEVPFITRSWNHLTVLEKIGIKVGKAPEKATFGRSKSVSVHYHKGGITLEKPLSIWLGDWELAVLDGGWLHTQTDQHDVRGELLASEKVSMVLRPLILKGLGMLPEEIKETAATDVEEDLFRDDRLLVKMKSSGDFSDPKVRPDGKIVDFSKAAKDAAKKLFKQKAGGLLEGLLK